MTASNTRKEFTGLHTYRFADNPHEEIAAKWWADLHWQGPGSGVLPYLLGNGQNAIYPSDRDWQVASTLMQWLGSPVGRGALRDLVAKFDDEDKRIKERRRDGQ